MGEVGDDLVGDGGGLDNGTIGFDLRDEFEHVMGDVIGWWDLHVARCYHILPDIVGCCQI